MEYLKIFTAFFQLMTAFFKREKASDQISRVVAIYDAMKTVISETDAERFIILKAENGGGAIKPGAVLYFSAVYEDFRDPLTNVKYKYQRQLVDQHYMSILADCYLKGSLQILIKDMPECDLKNIWQAEGINYAEVFFLHQTKSTFYYCFIKTTSETSVFKSSEQRNEINLSVNNIKNLLKGKKAG